MTLLLILTPGLAAAQAAIVPEAAPMLESRPPRAGATMLIAPAGWRYQLAEAPPSAPQKRWGLFTAGIVMLSVSWCANLQAGIPTGEWRLDVPLIGPLLEIERLTSGDPMVAWIDFMLVTDAVVQLGGLALMIAGGTTYKHKPAQQRIQLVPLASGAAIRRTF